MDLEIINIAANSKNNKDIKNHTHYSKLKNSTCGDEIQIKLIIKGEKITNFGYQTDSCVYCQASASLLSKISTNSKKDKIIKFEGGYHGMSAEAQMSLSPSNLVNFPQPVPDSAGIPKNIEKDILIAPFNDIDFINSIITEFKDEIAGIIVEPLQRIIPPEPGFLEGLRSLCDKNNILLIFDEIVTGFRLAYGGAQEKYNVTPDLCTLGKIIGGGFPLAAIAGSSEIMSHFDQNKVGKDKWLMQIGTLSGNPIASAAGLKTMEVLRREKMFDKLRKCGNEIMNCLNENLKNANIGHRIVGDPTLFDVLFLDQDVKNYRDTKKADIKLNALFNKGLRMRGIFKSSAKIYPSLAISDEDLFNTKKAIHDTVLNLV